MSLLTVVFFRIIICRNLCTSLQTCCVVLTSFHGHCLLIRLCDCEQLICSTNVCLCLLISVRVTQTPGVSLYFFRHHGTSEIVPRSKTQDMYLTSMLGSIPFIFLCVCLSKGTGSTFCAFMSCVRTRFFSRKNQLVSQLVARSVYLLLEVPHLSTALSL